MDGFLCTQGIVSLFACPSHNLFLHKCQWAPLCILYMFLFIYFSHRSIPQRVLSGLVTHTDSSVIHSVFCNVSSWHGEIVIRHAGMHRWMRCICSLFTVKHVHSSSCHVTLNEHDNNYLEKCMPYPHLTPPSLTHTHSHMRSGSYWAPVWLYTEVESTKQR